MHRVVFGLAFVAAFLSAASLPEDYSLFFDPISSSGSHDNFDASGYFDYDDSAHLDTSMGNDDPDLNLYAKDDCASILGSGPSSRMRRRTDQCISSDSAPQLQIPTLDRSPTGESVLESLENYEVCPMMVFGNRNIPICESGSISDRKFDFGTSGYTLEHCVLWMSALDGCFFYDGGKDTYCCSKYEADINLCHESRSPEADIETPVEDVNL